MNNPKQTPSYPLDLGGPGKCIQRENPWFQRSWSHKTLVLFSYMHSQSPSQGSILGRSSHTLVRWRLPIISALGRLRQGAQEFRVSLEYRTNLKPALATWNLDFKMNLFSKTTVKTCRPFVSDELCFVLFCYRLFPHFIDKRRSPLWNRLLPVFG